MTYYLRSGASYHIASKDALDIQESLPVGTYTVRRDPMTGIYYLELVGGFQINHRLYGDTMRTTDRILRTFLDRGASTGVMLSGDKGSGKTLQAKHLSTTALDMGIPTILVNEPWHGEAFNGFIQSIDQETVIIFDEFEKTYDSKEQEAMLTLLDGVYPSKKLFIITCNDKYRVNEHMRNRPGRIFYRIDYSGLSREFIEEYCNDNLRAKEHIDTICRIAVAFSDFNFDIMKAMVEEMNRYGETPQEVMKVLNAKPEYSDTAKYVVTLRDKEQNALRTYQPTWQGNPLTQETVVYYHLPVKRKSRRDEPDLALGFFDDDDVDEDGDNRARFSVSDLRQVDSESGKFVFQNAEGLTLELEKERQKHYNWEAF